MTSAHWLIAMKVWLILLLVIPKSDAEVSCTAGAFPQNSKASVICNFNQDLNVTRQNFNVVQHVSKDATDSGNYVLLCNWGTTELECNTKDGYSFNKRAVSTRVTLDIPRMSTSQEGVYVCQIVPGTSSVTPNTCELTIGVSSTSTTTQPTVPCPTCPTPTSGLASTTLPGGPGTSDIARHEKNNSGSESAIVALAICLVIFILLFLTAMAVLRYVRKSFHFVRKNDYCPWIPDFWTLKRFHHGEAQMSAADPASLVEQLQEDGPLRLQPDATTQPLIPPRTRKRSRAASTNATDDKDVTLNIENVNDAEAEDTGATTKAGEHQPGEYATDTEAEKDPTQAEHKSKAVLEDDAPIGDDDTHPLPFLSMLLPQPTRGNED